MRVATNQSSGCGTISVNRESERGVSMPALSNKVPSARTDNVPMTETIEKSLAELDFASLTRRTFTPSPAAWEDQVLYFLLLDRFSDGNEKDGYKDNADRLVHDGMTPLYRPENSGRIDYEVWLHAGDGWQGGTLKGLRSKLGYLRRLGITALWVSPVFRQVAFEPTYHGYGIQNFLDVDPHFGTRE